MNDSSQKPIKTAAGVVSALGGPAATARLAGCAPQSITNARANGRLPYWSFLILTGDLAEIGRSADPRIWGIRPRPKR